MARSILKHAWNAFQNQGLGFVDPFVRGPSNGAGVPDRQRFRLGNERSLITSVYTRLAIDCAGANVRHCRVNENGEFQEAIDSGLNNCLTVEANIDQSAMQLLIDICMTMFQDGVAAIVPIDLTLDPAKTTSWDIKTMRVGTVVAFYPKHVTVNVFDVDKMMRRDITLEKTQVGIVVNPFYAVMNEPNSTVQRLSRKLAMLDVADDKLASNKLDIIIQLPYVIRSETKRLQAKQRRADLEEQMQGSQLGIGYIDGTEKIVQLNRPAENNLLSQVEGLHVMLYGQLGVTAEIMNGTATGDAMLNYMHRTLEPILNAITGEMKRKFLTKTARSQMQSVEWYRSVFKYIPLEKLGDIVDATSRNEVLTGNEWRNVLGMTPSKDPNADKLQNSNMAATFGPNAAGAPAPAPTDAPTDSPDTGGTTSVDDMSSIMNDSFDQLNSSLDDVFNSLPGTPDVQSG